MKTMYKLWLLCVALLTFAACENDGDKVFLSSLTGNELAASSDQVVLEAGKSKLFALSFAWTSRTLKISNPDMGYASGQVTTSLQVSTSADFSSDMKEETVTGLSKSYTGSELNILANSLNLTEPVASDVYFRLAGRTGDNMEPVYSNVVKVNLTPYKLDTHFADVLDQNAQDTQMQLYSVADNQVYSGFVGASAWYNFLVREADGTLWRTQKGSAFILTTEGDYKLWYPGQSGCYYTTVDVPGKQWQALLMPSLTVSGIEGLGKMNFDIPARQWTGSFTATKTGSVTIRISGTGKLYTHTSADGETIQDDKAVDTPFNFSGTAGNLTFATGSSEGTDITVDIPQTGACTLTIDLSNPQQLTASVTAGQTVTYPDYLSLYSAGGESKWLSKMPASTIDGEKGVYYGVFQMTKGWDNFRVVDDAENIWYGSPDGSPSQLEGNAVNNLWIENAAAESYLIKADLAGKSWSGEEITQINVCGGFNGWDLTKDLMTYDASTQTWTATCQIGSTDNGFYFLLNKNWEFALKGTEKELYLAPSRGDGAYVPATTGTYRITLNLRTMTFTMDKQ